MEIVALKLLLVAITASMFLGSIIEIEEKTRRNYCMVTIVSMILTVITFFYLN